MFSTKFLVYLCRQKTCAIVNILVTMIKTLEGSHDENIISGR